MTGRILALFLAPTVLAANFTCPAAPVAEQTLARCCDTFVSSHNGFYIGEDCTAATAASGNSSSPASYSCAGSAVSGCCIVIDDSAGPNGTSSECTPVAST